MGLLTSESVRGACDSATHILNNTVQYKGLPFSSPSMGNSFIFQDTKQIKLAKLSKVLRKIYWFFQSLVVSSAASVVLKKMKMNDFFNIRNVGIIAIIMANMIFKISQNLCVFFIFNVIKKHRR